MGSSSSKPTSNIVSSSSSSFDDGQGNMIQAVLTNLNGQVDYKSISTGKGAGHAGYMGNLLVPVGIVGFLMFVVLLLVVGLLFVLMVVRTRRSNNRGKSTLRAGPGVLLNDKSVPLVYTEMTDVIHI